MNPVEELIKAIKSNKLPEALELIKQVEDIGELKEIMRDVLPSPIESLNALVHLAIKEKKLDVVKSLYDSKNVSDAVFYMMLATAFETKNAEMIDFLITTKPSLNYDNDINLEKAVLKTDDETLVEKFIQAGGNFSLCNNGEWPLMYVQSIKILEYLAKKGTVLRFQYDANHYAEALSADVIDMIIKKFGEEGIKILTDNGFSLDHDYTLYDSREEIYPTSLLKNIVEKNLEAVQILVKYGANLNFRDDKGYSALEYMAYCPCDEVREIFKDKMENLPFASAKDKEMHWAMITEMELDKFLEEYSKEGIEFLKQVEKKVFSEYDFQYIYDHLSKKDLSTMLFSSSENYHNRNIMERGFISYLVRSKREKLIQEFLDDKDYNIKIKTPWHQSEHDIKNITSNLLKLFEKFECPIQHENGESILHNTNYLSF